MVTPVHEIIHSLTLLHLERPKLHTIFSFLSAIGLNKPWYNCYIQSNFSGSFTKAVSNSILSS